MPCRNVIALLLAAGLLAGCEGFKQGSYEVQKQLGMYPVDPPRQEAPMPPPGSVSQASWAAQRAASAEASQQGNTTPIGYKEPEKPAAPPATSAADAKTAPTASAATAAPPPRTAAAAPPTTRMPPSRLPAAAAAPATPVSPTVSGGATVVASVPGLPAGYTPSASVVDQPAQAAEQQTLAAAAGALPTPPELAGSMKAGMATMPDGSWRAHLASHRTESAAINEWQELLRANPALYGQFDPQIEWVDTQRGSFARLLLVGFADRKAADDACAKLRSATRYCAAVNN